MDCARTGFSGIGSSGTDMAKAIGIESRGLAAPLTYAVREAALWVLGAIHRGGAALPDAVEKVVSGDGGAYQGVFGHGAKLPSGQRRSKRSGR